MSDLTLNIRHFRERAGFTRQQVAILLEMSLEEYTAIEEEKAWPTMEMIVRLSHICHTTCDELIGFQLFDIVVAEKEMKKLESIKSHATIENEKKK